MEITKDAGEIENHWYSAVSEIVFSMIFAVFLLQFIALFLLNVVRSMVFMYFLAIECFLRPHTTIQRVGIEIKQFRMAGYCGLDFVKKHRLWELLWKGRFFDITKRAQTTFEILFQDKQKTGEVKIKESDTNIFEEFNGINFEDTKRISGQKWPLIIDENGQEIRSSTNDHHQLDFFLKYKNKTLLITSQFDESAFLRRGWLGFLSTLATTELLLDCQPLSTTTPTTTREQSSLLNSKNFEENLNQQTEELVNRAGKEILMVKGKVIQNLSKNEQHILKSYLDNTLKWKRSRSKESIVSESSISATSILTRKFLNGAKLFKRPGRRL